MYKSDSKYLIINIAKRNRQLKYKNRVLKDVHFKRVPVSDRANRLTHGALTLTQKIEGPRQRKLLIFDKDLVLQGKNAPEVKHEEGIPRYSLRKRLSDPFIMPLKQGRSRTSCADRNKTHDCQGPNSRSRNLPKSSVLIPF